MKKVIFTYVLLSSFLFRLHAQTDSATVSVQTESITIDVAPGENQQEPVYKLKPKIDIPLTAAATAWTLYGFKEIYSKPSSSVEEIQRLRVADIPGFDRWAADLYSEKAAKASDMFFYASMPLPLLLLADKEIRKDAAKVGLIFIEAMSVTGVFYTGTNYTVNRYRPYAYNPNVPMDERRGGGATNSFIGGHPALVATSTFFMAKVFSDYHPESKFKWVMYTTAAAATGATAYLRHRAGKHFPSDLVAGVGIGTLSGILIPHWHKNRALKNKNFSVTPFTGQSHGLHLVYRL